MSSSGVNLWLRALKAWFQAVWRPKCLGKTSSLMIGALAVHGELGSSSVWSVL